MSSNQAIEQLTQAVQEHTDVTQSFLDEADQRVSNAVQEAEEKVDAAIPSITILATDAYRKSIEDASGGKNTVIYDAQGNPNVMVVVPRFNVEDLNCPDLNLGVGVHPAFETGGTPRSEILVAKYLASTALDGNAVIGGAQPLTNVNYDEAKELCENKGANWHLMSIHEWAAIALWSFANETEPRGNTNYGRSHEAYLESAVRADNGFSGDVSGTARTGTGKGPVTWNHTHDAWGIADLTGNVWEWLDQMKLENGQILTTNNNDPSILESAWDRHVAYFDSPSSAQDGYTGSPILSDRINQSNGPIGDDSNDYAYMSNSHFATITQDDGYAKSELLRRLLIESETATTAKGGIYVRNHGERFPLRGGNWHIGSIAGVGALDLNYSRVIAYSNIGFRPAFFV